ncbi:hypothetical protein [Corynebacterium canis]|uniref:hypothetical protein n=1 Tax=Corynebacterium canis TaxID=679663 RepID=UPI0011B51AD0|nr:hypothetical protein [Corynebacterium canis]
MGRDTTVYCIIYSAFVAVLLGQCVEDALGFLVVVMLLRSPAHETMVRQIRHAGTLEPVFPQERKTPLLHLPQADLTGPDASKRFKL